MLCKVATSTTTYTQNLGEIGGQGGTWLSSCSVTSLGNGRPNAVRGKPLSLALATSIHGPTVMVHSWR